MEAIKPVSKPRKRAGAGYMRSRWNATKHGLTAEHSVLPGDDQEAYATLKKRYLEEWKPKGPTGESLVEQLVEIAWKLMRYRRFEQAEYRAALLVRLSESVREGEDGRPDYLGVNELAIAHKAGFLPHSESILVQVFGEPFGYTEPGALLDLQSEILDLVENELTDEIEIRKAQNKLPPKLKELWHLAVSSPDEFKNFRRFEGLPPVEVPDNSWQSFESWVFDFALPYLHVLHRRHPMSLAAHKQVTDLAYLDAIKELDSVSKREEQLHSRYQKVLTSLMALDDRQAK